MNKKQLFLLTIIILLISGCTATQPSAVPSPESLTAQPQSSPELSGKITVMAAASLTESFSQIGVLFEGQYPGTSLVFNFAGSQQLAQQIAQGAPADVFASANQKQMDVVVETSRVDKENTKLFVKNRLILIYPDDNPGHITNLTDLASPGLKIVLAAHEVPAGQYSLELLAKASQDDAYGADYQDKVLLNVVSYEDNIKAVLTKVSLGEADAGIVYSSDTSEESAKSIKRIDIPDELNVIATYPISVINDSANLKLANAFVDLVLSKEGQEILAKYGFIPVTE